jgi:hypothetical protein
MEKDLHSTSFCQKYCKGSDKTLRSYLTIFFINDISEWINKVLDIQDALNSKIMVSQK